MGDPTAARTEISQVSPYAPEVVREVLCLLATRPRQTSLSVLRELWGKERAHALGRDHIRGIARMLDALVGFGVLEVHTDTIDEEPARTYALHASFPKSAIRIAIDRDVTLWQQLVDGGMG